MLNRRPFLYGATALALGGRFAAAAQLREGPARIVALAVSTPPDHARAFENGLRNLGHAPDSTIVIEHRAAETRATSVRDLAREAVTLRPQVIVAIGTTAALAAHQATKDLAAAGGSGD